jgi:hypothetical protein
LTILALAVTGCSIRTNVDPLTDRSVRSVCIKENENVWTQGFLPALRAEFEQHGIKTSVYRDDRPAECRYHALYTANWSWDLALYLEFADVQIFDGDRSIARATYDASEGAANLLGKFGSTEAKLHDLMAKLLGPGTPPTPD